jgi:hypothetical protein
MKNYQFIDYLKQFKMKSLKTYLSCLLIVGATAILWSQEEEQAPNQADFNLGEGLQFSFNEGNYLFNIGGFIQPSASFEKLSEADADYFFNSKRTYLIIRGKALEEKVSFLLQSDFSFNQPLLDAWVAYHPTENITISAGQKQTFLNNREMIYREDRLQFTDRSRLSQLFSETGREFGLFVEGSFGTEFIISPAVAITSGDGRNSFGSDSRDTDKGGVKYGARLDIYPLGAFKKGNDRYTSDLAHESQLKMLLGGAISYNNGASGPNGEGHGDFLFFDANGIENLPDYSQQYLDLLLKYKGFSFLGEYVNASARGIELAFLDTAGANLLVPSQVSNFLVLGSSYSLQTGYVTKSGYSLDLRYEQTTPEFENNLNSILLDANSYSIGFTKYFRANNLKLQASYSKTDFAQGTDISAAEILMQIVF